MIAVTFSELRNNAKKFFDLVEEGEVIEVYRHGKPVAVLSPVHVHSLVRWKNAQPLRLDGVSVSRAILKERSEDR
jgi:prevent-host-death family protein